MEIIRVLRYNVREVNKKRLIKIRRKGCCDGNEGKYK